MINPPKKKLNRLVLFGCLAPLGACLVLGLVMLIAQPIKSAFNLCDLTSPAGCQKLYRPGGEINLGHTLALSADGRFLAVGNRDLLILDTATGKTRASASLQSDPNYPCEVGPAPVAISPSGNYAAGYTFYDNCVFLLNATDGSLALLQQPMKSDFSVDFLAFAPDGKALYYTNPDGTLIYRYDLADKRIETWFEARGPLDISPQGLMVVAVKNEIQFWRLAEKPQLEHSLPLEMEKINSASISPDETILAVVFYTPDTSELNSQLIEISSGKVLADQLEGYDLDFSPDGKFLAARSGAAFLYQVEPGGKLFKVWTAQRLVFTIYDPFGFSASNLVLDPETGQMYYGEQGVIGRFRIP